MNEKNNQPTNIIFNHFHVYIKFKKITYFEISKYSALKIYKYK